MSICVRRASSSPLREENVLHLSPLRVRVRNCPLRPRSCLMPKKSRNENRFGCSCQTHLFAQVDIRASRVIDLLRIATCPQQLPRMALSYP